MIQQLMINNFKCFGRQTLPLQNLTILAGLNGMGKSTVLQSLLLLRQSYQQGVLPKIGLALNGNFVNIGSAQDAIFEGAAERKLGFDLRFSDGTKAHWRFDYDDQADVLALASDPVEVTGVPTELFHDNFNYIQAERIGPRKIFDMSDYMVKQHRQLGTQGEYAFHFLSAFRNDEMPNPKVAHPSAPSLRLIELVEGWMQEIRPGTQLDLTAYPDMDVLDLKVSFSQFNPFFRLDNASQPKLQDAGLHWDVLKKLEHFQDQKFFHEDEFTNAVRQQLGEKDAQKYLSVILDCARSKQESRKFRSTNVGFGITYTLPIVVALVSAKPGSLILLENPEAHLHPRGQAKLGELMALAASGGVQIIVETHSDHVLNGIRVATYHEKISPDDIALHFFESEVQDDIIQVNVRHPQIDSDGRIDEWPDGFFDEWDKCLEILLIPKEEK